MTSYNTDGKVGTWALEKLECLADYLSPYTTILKSQKWCEAYYYIDAFAGAGKNELRKPIDNEQSTQQLLMDVGQYFRLDKDEESYVNGSTYVALNIPYPFSKYFFIELSKKRIEKLEKIKTEYGESRNIEIIHNDASSALSKILLAPNINWKKCRGIVFLDPFGMQVSWNIIEEIAKNGSLEILLNLPVGMAIQRLLPRSGDFTEDQRLMLTEYFGSPDWQDVIYERTTDLFGQETSSKMEASGERLATWYQSRLKKLFGYAPPPRLITNSNGSHLYYLLFAGPNSTGAKIASHVLNQGSSIKSKKRKVPTYRS